ncbi:MAG: hypothetical protein IJ265_03965, partial [Oscillospiraceae bacterium]|nr:hypothetical protein [Oscillospiraceae bacterium]
PHLARYGKIDVLLFNSKTNNSNDALLASIMQQTALFRKKESPRSIGSFQMRLPVRAPHLARYGKIDVLLFNSKTNNSNDALRSKHHAASRTIPQKRKPL